MNEPVGAEGSLPPAGLRSSPALAALPDLHRHLDGSLRPSTLAELAAARGLTVPPDLAFTPAMGLDAALARFAFTLSLLQDTASVRRVAAEICRDAAAEGVTTLEIRFAPQLHLAGGATLEGIIDAALEGIDEAAGLILCGLYGEPPEVLARSVAAAASRPGVVGVDLAGGPVPGHRFALEEYAGVFEAAADLGLGRTVHAAEGRPAAEIATAIRVLHAQRIGHGTTLLSDPAVLELVLERGVTLEACPTSNVHTGVIAAVADHPLPRWLEAGVAATVCSDNTLLSGVGARDEHLHAGAIPGMTPALLARSIACGHAARFRRYL